MLHDPTGGEITDMWNWQFPITLPHTGGLHTESDGRRLQPHYLSVNVLVEPHHILSIPERIAMSSLRNAHWQADGAIQEKLDLLLDQIRSSTGQQVGFPGSQEFDYSPLLPFLQFSLNNVGDPFHDSGYRSNTHEIEREVIARFAELTHLDPDLAWGYVTSGGTEGNMYGLYLARELFPNAMFYFSEDTHYSVLKNVRVLNARYIMIKSQENGEIDYQDLYEMIRVHRDLPAVVMANIGTTVRGAVDDLERIKGIFNDLAVTNTYIHADAALSGLILPFVAEPQPFGFDSGIDSISISGHKLIGAPLPCGVVVTRRTLVERVGRAVEYVGVHDTTLSGSRNGFAPLMLWYALATLGEEGLRDKVARMLDTAEYAVRQFNKFDIPAWRHRNSATIVFPKPAPSVFIKWQIAPEGRDVRIVTMPHVTRDMIDELVLDCAR